MAVWAIHTEHDGLLLVLETAVDPSTPPSVHAVMRVNATAWPSRALAAAGWARLESWRPRSWGRIAEVAVASLVGGRAR